MINKVNNFTLKVKINEDDFNTTKEVIGDINKIFTIGFSYFLKNFEFDFSENQVTDNQFKIIELKNKTDWIFDDQDRSINCFYTIEKNIILQIMFCDKYFDVSIDTDHLYFIPSWMSYRFLSDDKEKKIVNFWFNSLKKIIKKENNIVW
jgi:hypothetical protein